MEIAMSDIAEVIGNVTSFPILALTDDAMVFQCTTEHFSTDITLELFTYTTTFDGSERYGLKLFGTFCSAEEMPIAMRAKDEEYVPALCTELGDELVWCRIRTQYDDEGFLYLELYRAIHLDEEAVSGDPDSQLITAIDDMISEWHLLSPLAQAIARGDLPIDQNPGALLNITQGYCH